MYLYLDLFGAIQLNPSIYTMWKLFDEKACNTVM